MLACIYAGPLIGIWMLAEASQAAEPVSITYYFLPCVRDVASSMQHLKEVCIKYGVTLPLKRNTSLAG